MNNKEEKTYYDSNNSEPEQNNYVTEFKVISTRDLIPFKDHPYKVVDDADMDELAESIKEIGLINPLLVRPKDEEEGKYEIISGHRRFHAAQKLGISELPCTVYYVDRDTAIELMVTANCQRSSLLPSEKARAYKMKLDAMKRQGKRSDLSSGPVGPKSKRSNELLAESVDESASQIKRYIRLNELVPELLQFVDEGKIRLRTAVELSYLNEEIQRDIVDCIDGMEDEAFPSFSQIVRIRKRAEEGRISYNEIEAIITEKKPNQIEKVKIPIQKLRDIFGKDHTDAELAELTLKALNYYKLHLQRQRNQAR